MRVYRALNWYDEENIKIRQQILSGLFNKELRSRNIKSANLTFSEKDKKDLLELKKKCLFDTYDINYILENVVAHIQGSSLKNNNSAFISTTKNFKFAAYEYSIPQSGKYNYIKNRKNIAIIDFDETKEDFVDSAAKLKERIELFKGDNALEIRKKVNKYAYLYPHILDLTNKKLEDYRINGDLPVKNDRFPFKKKKLYPNGQKSSVEGYSNYATKSEEVLALGYIGKNSIKEVLLPDEIDLAYFANLDMNDNNVIKMLKSNDIRESLNNFKKNKDLDNLIGNNIIDIIANYYKEGKSNHNLENFYEELCKLKKELLNQYAMKYLSYTKIDSKSDVLDRGYDVCVLHKGEHFINKGREHDLVAVDYYDERGRNIYIHTYNNKTSNDEWVNIKDSKDILDKKLIFKTKKMRKI